ncbi:MAG: acetyl-CoA carboxylase biotin carboxyl carrier protein subunit [Nitrospirota bacterium]|nr:acetyl-CoA carboxylase biotin carboxyl carrier protein subunit [Nitrospirota bacterium]
MDAIRRWNRESWREKKMKEGSGFMEVIKVINEMAGTVVEVRVSQEANIQEGDTLFVLESMKMQIEVQTPVSGLVRKINVEEGDFIDEGSVLAEIEEVSG